jgi:hypothetical protein
MFGSVTPSANASAEYEAIEATISASERGRWFLAEYGRRHRGAETEVLLGAIARLERSVTVDRGQEAFGHLRGNLLDMADAISRTKAEIAAISAPNSEETRLTQASLALDAIVRETEQATSDILSAAEAIQEAAWTLRERGADALACDALDRHATAIYTACSFQDLTAQRTARIVYTLRYLEDRVSAMIAIWGEDAVRVPPPPGTRTAGEPSDLNQSDIDRYIAMDVPAVTAAALVARPGSPALHEDLVFLPVSDAAEAEARTEDAAAGEAVDQGSDEAVDASEPVADPAPERVAAVLPAADVALAPDAAGESAADPVAEAWAEAWAEPDAVRTENAADLAWGDVGSPPPEPAMPPETPALSFAQIDALTPEQRLALFA